MTPNETAKAAAAALESKNAQDLKILEVGDLTVLADYFILATATSNTHMKTLCGECEFILKQKGAPPRHIESTPTWTLLDFGSVVVHVFLQETRAFYSLERLWSDAKVIDNEQLKIDN